MKIAKKTNVKSKKVNKTGPVISIRKDINENISRLENDFGHVMWTFLPDSFLSFIISGSLRLSEILSSFMGTLYGNKGDYNENC